MVEDIEHLIKAFKYNGHGRIDQVYADPYIIQRSISDTFNISSIISGVDFEMK